MKRLSNKLRNVKAVLAHPLNADRKVSAGLGLAKKMLGAKGGGQQVPFDWVNDTKMLRGSSVTNGNDQWLFGLTEFRDMAFLLHYLRPGDLFCDVGANEGAFSILAGAACGANVLACEPVPATYKLLEKNFALNGLEGDAAQSLQVAVGAEQSVVKMAIQGRNTLTSVACDEVSAGELVEVPVRPLDEICKVDQPVALLKVDVEGFESAVVGGMQKMLERGEPAAVIIELSGFGDRYGFDEQETFSDLVASGLKPIQYDPYTRKMNLLPVEDAKRMLVSTEYSNCLLVREPDAVGERLAAAPAFSISGRKI